MTRKAHRHDLSVWFDGSEIAERDDALTMQGVKHSGHEKQTLLELVLQLHGEFRRSLEPIRVTPTPSRVAPLSASSCGRQTDRRLNHARREVTDIECGSQNPRAEAVDHQTPFGYGYPCRVFVAQSAG